MNKKVEKKPIIVLSASHDVLVTDRKKMDLPTFQVSAGQPIELDIRDFISKKLKASLVCMLGIHKDGPNEIPVVLVDETDYEPPKRHGGFQLINF